MENNFICYRVCINIIVGAVVLVEESKRARENEKRRKTWNRIKSLFPIKLSKQLPFSLLNLLFLLHAPTVRNYIAVLPL